MISMTNNINKDNQIEDPTDNSHRVLIRNTVTGFEQGIAAAAGFFTGGPIAAIASWGAIRGLQGKWTPWFVLGIPSCEGINLINIAMKEVYIPIYLFLMGIFLALLYIHLFV